MQASNGEITFNAKLSHAAEYQVTKIMEILREKGIDLPQEEIQGHLVLSLLSHSLAEKIVKQIEACPKRMVDMSMKEKYAVAGWLDPLADEKTGDKETSHAVIESLISGTYKQEWTQEKSQSIKGKIVAAQDQAKLQTNKIPVVSKERDALT